LRRTQQEVEQLHMPPQHPLLPVLDQRIEQALTLEMGSWLWVRKNPRQFFSRQGLFNPLIEHRQQRVLRRHVQLLDFLLRATQGEGAWRPVGVGEREVQRDQALARWYRKGGARP
jgi:hypothetical protein